MPKTPVIAITAQDISTEHLAQALAKKLCLPYFSTPDAAPATIDYLLVFTPDFLGIQHKHDKKWHPFYIDFTAGQLNYRSKLAGRRTELIAKAMGIKPGEHPLIIDATAGLGRDSFILASIGYQIICLEKSPVIHALLENALARAKIHPKLADITQRMTLINADATNWLIEHTSHQQPDIIYLDPMFPEREKTALVKKEMALLQQLLPTEPDNDTLFKQALACAAKRVVVKRPRLAKPLADKPPTYQIVGKSSRFDIYLVQ